MNGELKPIGVEKLVEYLDSFGLDADYYRRLVNAGKLSDPLLEGTIGGELLCLVGFVPPTVTSDLAYLWMYSMPAVAKHKVCVGRFGRRLVAEALKRYPKIVGHCKPESAHWLASLGAEINGLEFTLRAAS